MKRREFITLLGGAAAWPTAARAQQAELIRRIAVLALYPESDPIAQPSLGVLGQSLEKLGWAAGRNIQIDYRWGISDIERAEAAGGELLRLRPDVIVTIGSPAVRALQQATRTVPIVFVAVSEPVSQGVVQSLANPGGNITGFTNLEPSVGGKFLEFLKWIAPRVTRVAVMFNPNTASFLDEFSRSAEQAAKKLAVEQSAAKVHTSGEIEATIETLGRGLNGGLILPPDTFTALHRRLIIDLANRYRVPAIYAFRHYAADGGLLSYGADLADLLGRAATYVDRILRGEKPASLPVQQPTKFELVINLKTAKALSLDVPVSLQQLADEVIE
jgi:putative tryptophan/tyrosine transport system substrate-binding protein